MHGFETKAFLQIVIILPFAQTALWLAKKDRLLLLPSRKKEKGFSAIQILGAFFIYIGLFRIFFFIIFLFVGDFSQDEGISRNESMTALFFSFATILSMMLYIKALQKNALRWVFYRTNKLSRYQKLTKVFWKTTKSFILFYPIFLFMAKALSFFVIFFFGKELPTQIILSQIKGSLHDPVTFIYIVVNVVIAVPILEEIFFRGIVQVSLIKWLGRSQGIIFSSLAFTAMHFSPLQGVSNLCLLPALFMTSLAIGIVYEKERNLWTAIIFHSLFNIVNLTVSIV